MDRLDILDVLRRRDAVVLVDGWSGAGKSTFADRLVRAWPGELSPVLVRMDDVYPGWDGLEAASEHVRDELLEPFAAGRSARWRRHDWVADGPAEWHVVPSGRPILVEGCGSLSRANARLATLRIWLDAPAALRKRRALERDRGAFDAHWDMWAAQTAIFVGREDPASVADVRLRTDGGDVEAWLGELGEPGGGVSPRVDPR